MVREDVIQKTLYLTETPIFAVHQFLKSFAEINFCDSSILKNFAGINYRDITVWELKKESNFAVLA